MKLIIIMLALIGKTYSVILSVIRLRSAENPTPENVSDVYDEETYLKWKKYSAEKSRLEIFSSVASLFVTFILLTLNIYSLFASLFPKGVFLQLLSVVIIEVFINILFEIVTGFISNMIIDQKYGFNKTTIKTFCADIIRSLVLNIFITLGLACLIWLFHSWLGNLMIIAFAAAVFLISMIIVFLYPVISRIGNKFTPLEDGELREKLSELLTKHGYKVRDIKVMDASRRTTKLNAYFTGFGALKTIVLYDNLVSRMSTEEICAVFSHELGHGLHKDVLKTQILNILNYLVLAFLVWIAVCFPEMHSSFGFSDVNYGFAYVLVGVFMGITEPVIGIIMNAKSRRAEFRADKQALSEGYGSSLITALKLLARDNFTHLSPSKVNVVMEYSHPPLSERIEAIQNELKQSV